MKETIKGKEVIAYKGMNSDMTCKGFQYEIGETYKTDKAKLCNYGFHACLMPKDILCYYPQDKGSRYFKVKLYGEISECEKFDTKVAATEITILEEITDNFNEVIETTEWWKNDNVLDLLHYQEDFVIIQRPKDQLYNFIDKEGNYLSDEWFINVYDFHDGLAIIQRGDGLWNYIDKQGNILSNEWFSDAYSFYEGVANVQRTNGEWVKIDKTGKFHF